MEREIMKSVALHNLGCKVNAYELDVMRQLLQEKGYQVVPFDSIADIYIVNTCTVTNISDRKSRQMLRRVKEINPEAMVVACGCYVQVEKEEVKKILKESMENAIKLKVPLIVDMCEADNWYDAK